MNKIKFFGLIAIVLLGLASCKTQQLGRKKVNVHEVDFNYMTSRAKVHYSDGKMKYTFTANFRVAKDSVIWASVSKAGFTLARLKISTDSVYVVNKFQREYYGYKIDEFNQLIGFDLNHEMIEDLFLGNLIVKPIKTDGVQKDSTTLTITSPRDPYLFENTINPKKGELLELKVKAPSFPKDSITVNYSEFKERFAHRSAVMVHTERSDSLHMIVNMKHSKVKFKDVKSTYPLGIKADYVKKN